MAAFMADDSIGGVNAHAAAGRGAAGTGRFDVPGPRDRRAVRRLTIAISAGFLLFAAVTSLDLMFSKKFDNATGRGEWLWAEHDMAEGTPVVFFAAYDFVLPADRSYVRIKILGDPEYMLYLNSVQIGGRRLGVDERHTLDLYDVSPVARDGWNRIVVTIRSANGVGGLIASLDLSPERQNVVVTGRRWKIFQRWDPDLLVRDPPGLAYSRPMLLGEPPMRRWNYLDVAPAPATRQPLGEASVRAAFSYVTALREYKTINGVVVVGNRKVRATAFDFGSEISGWGRVAVRPDASDASRSVTVRYASAPAELRSPDGQVDSFVFAPGETRITDPQERRFRYMAVYGCCNAATAQAILSR
jgi:hypothetical protein